MSPLPCTAPSARLRFIARDRLGRGLSTPFAPLTRLSAALEAGGPITDEALAGVMDIPARIYFGQLAGTQALVGLALQCLWTVLLVLLGRAAMGRTMRRLEVQGG